MCGWSFGRPRSDDRRPPTCGRNPRPRTAGSHAIAMIRCTGTESGLLSLPMHAAIAEERVTVNGTNREGFGGFAFVAVRIQETVADRGRVQLRPVAHANDGSVSRTEQNFGTVQFIRHRNEVRRKNMI